MKEKCHEGLAKLVAQHIGESRANISSLGRAAVEPDSANKETMRQDFLKILPVNWLIDHTVRAKELAMQSVLVARQKKQEGDPTWLRALGWGWHYMTDWATPYHSPTASVNPVPKLGLIGALAGAFIGGVSRAKEGTKGSIKGAITGAAIGGGLSVGAGAIDLAVNHSKFEQKIDAYWVSHEQEISKILGASTHNIKNQLEKMDRTSSMELLGNLLDELRNMANTYPKEDKGVNLSQYLAHIAVVLYAAYYCVIK